MTSAAIQLLYVKIKNIHISNGNNSERTSQFMANLTKYDQKACPERSGVIQVRLHLSHFVFKASLLTVEVNNLQPP